MTASGFAAVVAVFGDGFTRIVRRVEQVARAAPRVYERRREAVVNLAAQAVDVHVNEVRERVEVLVPDVLGDLGAREHAPALARHVFKERILLGRQLYLATGARDRVRAGVYNEVGDDNVF